MRYIILILATLLFFGCGGEDVATTTQVVEPPAPGPRLATLDASNALVVGNAASQLQVPGGRNSVELAGGNFSRIEIDNAASAIYELLLAYPSLIGGGNFRYSGPGGGNAEVAVNGAGVTIQFNGFVSADGARLDGQVFLITGDNAGTVSANFTGLRVTNPQASLQIDGPATLSRSLAQGLDGFEEQATRILNLTITDLRNGGSVRLIDLTSNVSLSVAGSTMTGSVANTGSLEFNQFQGVLDGLVNLDNTIPFTFTIDLANQIRTVTGGEIFTEGNGTIRRRIIANDTVELAVRPAGAADFTVVRVVQIPDAG